jgi:arginyl-tRNA--protein-N-Asp/Glu arginylyltransferase
MESFRLPFVAPEGMDELWSRGWRHFGPEFFRYSFVEISGKWEVVLPLRVDLEKFEPTKSQRRNLRKNAGIDLCVRPASLTLEAAALFSRHKTRFVENVPDSLASFLGPAPGTVPCACLELRCQLAGDLVALSFFDLGICSVSSVYGMFEPTHASRGLGIFTLLQEMEWARGRGLRYVYPGYATVGPSHYDYKKQFRGLEAFDWSSGTWQAWEG